MMEQSLHKWFGPLTQYLSTDQLETSTSVAVKALGQSEPVIDVIPSLSVGSDGISLKSLFLITRNFVCEVHMIASSPEFDFAPLSSIRNYRVRTWRHEIKEGEQVVASFELAEVKWLHDFGDGVASLLTFAGTAGDRQAWLDQVIAAVPPARMLEA